LEKRKGDGRGGCFGDLMESPSEEFAAIAKKPFEVQLLHQFQRG